MTNEDFGRIAITGGYGFLGWHLACRLKAMHGNVPNRLGRDDFRDGERLGAAIADADVIVHLAGVNRAATDGEVETGNIHIAEQLAAAVTNAGKPVHVVHGNSIQARNDSPYGRGKAGAADVLTKATAEVGGTFVDVLLPNLFGEHGKPNYNSFVATFCDALANGSAPEVKTDSSVPLMHAQRAARVLIEAAGGTSTAVLEPEGEHHKVSEVLTKLEGFRDTYANGEIPRLEEPFDVDLFNTYRSFVFPQHFPIHPTLNEDPRGALTEVVRAHGGTGMSFVSTTLPGKTRGDHYHLTKIERFFVAAGTAEISLRRLYGDEIVRFTISGDQPGFVDMPTLWVHNIRNVGEGELVTVFWADQLLDMEDPDQYPERVELDGVTA